RLRIDTLCRVEAVAEETDAIGNRADMALTGIDQGQSKIGTVDAERRENAPDAAAWSDRESSRRMRVLIVIGVIVVAISGCRCCFPDYDVVTAQHHGGRK